MKIPTAYEEGYQQARALNADLADEYLHFTSIGDEIADAAIDALADLGQEESARLIRAGMDQEPEFLTDAPAALRDFFAVVDEQPDWFDPDVIMPGRRAFHEYSDLFIPAFFVVTLMNAASLISKVFYATGRVRSADGVRRIRQNTRHFVEIMVPGALERQGDGWKLSVRIRLIRAQVRRLVRTSGGWDESVFGVPLSTAHMGLSSANFSASMIRHAGRLGAKMDAASRKGFMEAWRYASWLVGTPDVLLFEGDEEQTLELSRIASICEPIPVEEARAIARALVEAVPIVAKKDDPKDCDRMIAHVYRISRALLGDALTDQLEFPRYHTAGLLTFLRGRRMAVNATRRVAPTFGARSRAESLAFFLEASMLSDFSYQMPDRLKSGEASHW